MSNRRLILPDRAFEGVLQGMATKVRSIEKRSQWPGSVQLFSDTTSTEIVLVENIWTDLVEVPLDPGSWVLFASARMWTLGVNNILQLQIPDTESVPAIATAAGADGSSTIATVSLTLIGLAAPEERTTFVLQGLSLGGISSSRAYFPSVIAVPA